MQRAFHRMWWRKHVWHRNESRYAEHQVLGCGPGYRNTGSGWIRDPSTDGDVEKAANSNCTGTVYTNNAGEKFPPANTRESWSGAKAELVEEKYAICGLTYDLALRQYKYYPETTKEEATSVENFLLWALNGKEEGGGSLEKNTDYEKLPGAIILKAEAGVKQIGFEKEANHRLIAVRSVVWFAWRRT